MCAICREKRLHAARLIKQGQKCKRVAAAVPVAEAKETSAEDAAVDALENRKETLSEADIADIASADIPAEDVAMLEGGSNGENAAEDQQPAPAPRRRILKRAPAVDDARAASGVVLH